MELNIPENPGSPSEAA
jgi:hypothetical protein